MALHFTSDRHPDDGVRERGFTLGDVPGILWTPAQAPAQAPAPAPASAPASAPDAVAPAPLPLILLAHPPLGLRAMYPRLLGRARQAVADGFTAATVELPGSGDRPRLPEVEEARAAFRRALQSGGPVGERVVDALVLPLVDRAVPEWQAALDALLALPGIGGPVGFSGGLIAVGVRLAVVEPRLGAAGLFAGSRVPRATFEEARRVTVPLHVLVQWDDEGNDRREALDLFDAFGSAEKSLHAHMGGHTGVPRYAGDALGRFFTRHLRSGRTAPPAAGRRRSR
jgi:hypothetical protein